MSNDTKGILYAWIFAALEGLFPILSIFILRYIGALYAYAFSIMVAMVLFLIYLALKRRLHELWRREALYDLVMTALLINLMFVLIFVGLRYTSAGNMSVIIILQLFFAYLYFNVLGDEALGFWPTVGAFMMAAGGLIIVFPKDFAINIGDLLILLAAAIAPIANVYQKRAREHVSAETILAFRNTAAIPLLFLLAYYFEKPLSEANIEHALPYIFLNGVLVFTLAKILWIEALHFTSITKLSAMVSLIPLFTLLFAYLIFGDTPTARQLAGIAPVIAGSLLLSRKEAVKSK
jgi:drug/metabolite transporter (DMT)-like permease